MATRDEYLISAYHNGRGDFKLDTQLLDIVADGVSGFSDICERLGLDTKMPNKPENDWRRVDRRLQWLRKKRFLIFTHETGWRCLPPEKSAGAS